MSRNKREGSYCGKVRKDFAKKYGIKAHVRSHMYKGGVGVFEAMAATEEKRYTK